MKNLLKSFSILFQISEEDNRLKKKSDFRARRFGSCKPPKKDLISVVYDFSRIG